jgi:hypothetical protein
MDKYIILNADYPLINEKELLKGLETGYLKGNCINRNTKIYKIEKAYDINVTNDLIKREDF